ncbi:aminoglycoside 3'-phosphotransferase [Allokutzneria sp. A3M-2-11 16]|uniref:APH(3') family aminoglycoside O-phosphotransferase n=1 Tax=Allokutzneria sp. A3M-2-11 16 TaxID=2962043 RepID=UPI0020B6DF9C|nr:APH(3') family aminoglycoside O-phosphotransferase [Allokutzneria sp. A3M-2-11 16]MCP3799807.1 aminoglycoside 3'-phosphotransferase [Allokutzneria sp. A3M-2-11 16]
MEQLHSRYHRHAWEQVTIGCSGAGVWRLSGSPAYFLKTVEGGTDLLEEAGCLRWLRAQGLPAPEVVELGGDAEASWMVTAAVPGRSLAELGGDERAWTAGQVTALAEITRALHALPVADCPFDRTLDVVIPKARANAEAGLVDETDFDEHRLGSTALEVVKEVEATRPAREDLVVCHGDLCTPNVLLDPETLTVTGLIDVGRLGVADRYNDLALAARSLGPAHAGRFFAAYGEVPDPERLEFYQLLDEFF